MANHTFTAPDLTTFCRLDELGLVATGQELRDDRAVVECRVVAPDPWCRACGAEGRPRDTVTRELAHLPVGWRPTTLWVRVRRYECRGCHRVWRQDTSLAAEPGQKLSRAATKWALEALVVNFMSMARIADALGVYWHTANNAVLAEGRRLLLSDPSRHDGVTTIGVDEHCWRHTRGNGKYVTVIIDLTPVVNGTGTSRLLDMVDGRSKAVLQDWLDARPKEWSSQIEVVAMDGFTGYKGATQEALPQAKVVMDPFHVVQLAGQALDDTRCRVQQETLGHRGRRGDPLYGARHTLQTGATHLTERQRARLTELFETLDHAPVEATWAIRQDLIDAYREPDKAKGKALMEAAIKRASQGVPTALKEVAKLGRTLKRRATDILAYFDHPGATNGPVEATNGRIEYLRGIALGFRNLTNYIARSILHAGGFRQALHP